MNHLVLLGDSIFDNAVYVPGQPAVIDQVRQRLPTGWRATLLAVDGDVAVSVPRQLRQLPPDASHLVLSVGGNDALGCVSKLRAPASTVESALDVLAQIRSGFHARYRDTITALLALHRPLMVCTIYDHVPGVSDGMRAALALFNDVILREAIQHGLPVLDLRMIFTLPSDYSELSPIEPSSQGGAKLAVAMVAALSEIDFAVPRR
jgi:hypothetical protein